jgi:hypothetical protein
LADLSEVQLVRDELLADDRHLLVNLQGIAHTKLARLILRNTADVYTTNGSGHPALETSKVALHPGLATLAFVLEVATLVSSIGPKMRGRYGD